MKKFILTLSVVLTGAMFTSCSKDQEFAPQKDYPNKTLRALSAYNDSLLSAPAPSEEPIVTRSGWGTRAKDADVAGAYFGHLAGLSFAWLTGSIAPVTYLGTVLLSSAVSSAISAASNEAAPMDDQDTERFYGVADMNYQNSPQMPGDEIQTDALLTQIALPASYRNVSYLGRNHNEILTNWYASEPVPTRGPIEPDDPEDPIEPGDPGVPAHVYSSLYQNHNFEQSYANTVDRVGLIELSYNNDYVSYLNSHYDTNVSNTYKLFLEAYHNVNSTNGVISLVNQYINIIESNNEFTDKERTGIYAGLIIAVYSFNYWGNYGL